MTITRHTTAPADGPESPVEYNTYDEAKAVAQRDGLQVIARHYEFADSELVADFTRYHWLLTARAEGGGLIGDDGEDLYRPDGLDTCHDTPAEALDNLTERLTRALRELDRCDSESVLLPTPQPCGRCEACRRYESVCAVVRALEDVDADRVEEGGYSCTAPTDPDVPVVYRITRILSTQCDEDNHR